MFEWIYIILGALPLLYLYLVWNNNYWKKRGINQSDPLPGVGNLLETLMLKKTMFQIETDLYSKYPQDDAIGMYIFRTPALLIRTPELVQQVLVKDFSSFRDNYVACDKHRDPYLYRDPFFSKGSEWKIHRAALSPNFNSAKLKSVFPQMKEITKHMEEYLDNNLGEDILAKTLTFQFAADIVSNCFYGIEGNSFTGNEAVFTKMGDLMTEGLHSPIHVLVLMTFPKLGALLKWSFIPNSVGDFLKDTVITIEEYRKKNNVDRMDFLQYILNLRGKKIGLESDAVYSDIDVTGYAFTLFMEGFESASIVASFVLYELARNPDIQATLRTELSSVASSSQDLDYDKLHSVAYLDQVVSETLRKYPIVYTFTRVCTKDTSLEINGKSISIETGTPIVIPAFGLQNDPQYYPDPEKFMPERFSAEQVASRPQYTYMPFGEGPRICIGMRMGITQVKLLLAAVVLKYNILCTDKTPKQIEINKNEVLTTPTKPIYIKFEKRK